MTLVSLKNRNNEVTRRNNRLTFDDLFNNFFETTHEPVWKTEQVKPLSNILETKDEFKIEMAVPGVKKEDIKINLEKNVLTISSNLEQDADESIVYSRNEFNYSNFERAFILPKIADSEKINANFRDGILEVTITKKEEAKEKPARAIEVK